MTEHSTHPPAHTEHHADSVATYVMVFAALIALTIITTAVAFVNLGSFSVVAALGIATCKMLLVVLFFMHVRHSSRLTKLILVAGVLWLFIMLGMTYTDFGSRDWMGVPGR